MATGGIQNDPHTCAVCLGNFRDPKVLPCHHTFCALCIQDVADHHTEGYLSCPLCEQMTSLPSGGVASPQTNFNILPKTAKHMSDTPVMCKRHPDLKLRFYCEMCDEAICINCKITRHDRHPTDNLNAAASDKKKELNADQQRLQHALSAVRKGVTSLKKERQLLDRKREAVEKNIRNRHATVVAAADRWRDEALSSLQSVYSDMDKSVGSALEQRERDLAQLLDLLQQLRDAITLGTACDVITVAMEMRSGCGSQLKVDALTTHRERMLQRPVLQFDVSTEVIAETIRGYMGSVHTMELKVRRPEVQVSDHFHCAQDPDVEVFSLCHLDSDPPKVIVSYEWCGMEKNTPRKSFTESGKCTYTGKEVGKVSYKRYAKGWCTCATPQSGWFRTYCKSPTAAHFRLDNMLVGRADIDRLTVTCTEPFTTDIKTEFSILVGPHRAFDVDDTEQYFAVVEEGKKSTDGRRVHLYERSMAKAVSTYVPPRKEFQPSDVCFYTLGGQKVLLITDERNDAIHVVSMKRNVMRFECYLCAGCPSLIQPTAITVDVNNRLWVACRGGAVLMIEHVH